MADGEAVPAVVSEQPTSETGKHDINLRETLVYLVESNEASYVNSEGVLFV